MGRGSSMGRRGGGRERKGDVNEEKPRHHVANTKRVAGNLGAEKKGRANPGSFVLEASVSTVTVCAVCRCGGATEAANQNNPRKRNIDPSSFSVKFGSTETQSFPFLPPLYARASLQTALYRHPRALLILPRSHFFVNKAPASFLLRAVSRFPSIVEQKIYR